MLDLFSQTEFQNVGFSIFSIFWLLVTCGCGGLSYSYSAVILMHINSIVLFHIVLYHVDGIIKITVIILQCTAFIR